MAELPAEMYECISEYITDPKTYGAFSRINRLCRLVAPSERGKKRFFRYDTIYLDYGRHLGTEERVTHLYRDPQVTHIKRYIDIKGKHILIEEGDLINDLEEGEWKWYYDNGHLREIFTYRRGRYHGPHLLYYADGRLELREEYVNGRKWRRR